MKKIIAISVMVIVLILITVFIINKGNNKQDTHQVQPTISSKDNAELAVTKDGYLIVDDKEENDEAVNQEIQTKLKTDEQTRLNETKFSKKLSQDILDSKCVVHFGKPQTKACDQFKNIQKMDLENYSNLVLNDDVKTMYENAQNINLSEVTVLEIGQSDQGKVYQFILFFIQKASTGADYFFDYKIEEASIVLSEPEFEITPFETKNGFILKDLNFTNGLPTWSFVDGWENISDCVYPNQKAFYKQFNLGLEDEQVCLYVEQFDVSSLIRDVVIDGGGLVMNEDIIQPCLNLGTNELGLDIDINPLTITQLTCNTLKGADPEILKQFVNVTHFSVVALDGDVSFIQNYKNLEVLSINEAIDFDINWLNSMHNLKQLTLNDVNILNVDAFDNNSISLEHLNFMRSNFDHLEFLKYQYNLEAINLAGTGINQMPILGDNNALTELNLSRNEISSLEGFETFINLKTLNISRNNIQYMSNLDLNNGVWQSLNITFNPLDCTDPNLEYAKFVKSSCNRQLKP